MFSLWFAAALRFLYRVLVFHTNHQPQSYLTDPDLNQKNVPKTSSSSTFSFQIVLSVLGGLYVYHKSDLEGCFRSMALFMSSWEMR